MEWSTAFTALYAITNLRTLIYNFVPLAMNLLRLIGVSCITVYTHEMMRLAVNNFERLGCISTELDEDMRPTGIIFERRWIPRFVASCESHRIIIYTTPNAARDLIFFQPHIAKSHTEAHEKEAGTLTLGVMKGNFDHIRSVQKRVVKMAIEMTGAQQRIFEMIQECYQAKGFASVFVSGNVGTGKTLLAYAICQELGGLIIDFDPTIPSQTLDNVYMAGDKSKDNPLILLLDECDVLLQRVHAGIPDNKHYVTPVRNKTDFTAMMDRFQLGCFPFCIMVFISNRSKDEISAMDPAYLRPGRINVHATMNN